MFKRKHIKTLSPEPTLNPSVKVMLCKDPGLFPSAVFLNQNQIRFPYFLAFPSESEELIRLNEEQLRKGKKAKQLILKA